MLERKRKPHFPDEIMYAFRDVKLSAEYLPTYIELFSGYSELNKLTVKKNQIIFGRRGTGKSHFLKAFNQKINNDLETNICSTYISCLDFVGTSENMGSYVYEKKYYNIASEYYKKFLEKFCEHLMDHPKFWEIAKNKKETESIYSIMVNEIMKGSETVKERIKIKVVEKSKKTTRGFLGGLSLSKLFSAGASIESESEKNNDDKEIINIYYKTDLSKVRELIDNMLTKADIERLYICIDEWSELDKSCNTPIQQYFAQRLKQTFFKSQRVSVKIASIWSLTEMNSKEMDGRFFGGIELGQDIYKGFDLDTLFFNDKTSIEKFLRTIIYKRFIYASNTDTKEIFQKLQGKEGFDPKEFLIKEIFDSNEAFNALVSASHGIPRDFLELFDLCLHEIRDIRENRITTPLVIEVSADFYKSTKRNLISGNEILISFVDIIDSYLEKTNERFFILKNGDVKDSSEIKELVDKRFLHQLPTQLIDRKIRNKYKVFLIDYGCLWDWRQSKKIVLDKGVISPVLNLTEEQISNIDNYILSLDGFSKVYLHCNECKRTFFSSHNIYVKHKMCPHCGEYINFVK